MFYSKEEISELKKFAAAYGYDLELTFPEPERESALPESLPAEVIRVVPELLLPGAREEMAS